MHNIRKISHCSRDSVYNSERVVSSKLSWTSEIFLSFLVFNFSFFQIEIQHSWLIFTHDHKSCYDLNNSLVVPIRNPVQFCTHLSFFFHSIFGGNLAITFLQEKYPKVSDTKSTSWLFVAVRLFVNHRARGEINVRPERFFYYYLMKIAQKRVTTKQQT